MLNSSRSYCPRIDTATVGQAYRAGQSAELSFFYGGMTLPDKPHLYELHVFALEKMLDVRKGFLLNDLYRAVNGHILGQYTLKGVYEN